MTVITTQTGELVQRAQAANEASVKADVRFTRDTNPWGNLKQLTRTYGQPREVGEGTRSAIHRFGPALERLADN